MKNVLLTLSFLCFTLVLQSQSKLIKGKLTHLDAPLANADVMVKDADTRAKTGVDGSYSISAQEGDVIVYSYPSLESVEIIVEDVTSILNVSLYQKVTQLDEVIVKGSNRKSQEELEEEYGYNPNLIKTAWGILDKETAPGVMRFLVEDDINAVAICIMDLLRNQFAGVRVSGDCSRGGTVTIRGLHSINFAAPTNFNIDGIGVSGDPIIDTQDATVTGTVQVASGALNSAPPAIFDVDGQILREPPIWILPNAMERVAVLSSLSLTTRYGAIGAGGVVVINTKAGSAGLTSNKILDRARLRNNKYQNDAIGKETISKNLPTYLEALYASADLNAAKDLFAKNKLMYRSSPYYFIDGYNYFMENGDSKFAKEIIADHMYLFEDHPVHAKALAYHLDTHGQVEQANELYEQIFILRPSYAQSYRDLAESYREVGNYTKSASMYARHNYLLKEGFLDSDSVGILPIIERESENLLVLKGDKVMNGLNITERLAKFTEFEGTRLFFEWNDSEAEFELQFVNPENHFYTWKHTLEANAERIRDEKIKGYSSEEFLIDGSLPGRWQVNINYKGNKKLEPTYLKVTTYYNYGKPAQRKQVNVYRLGIRNVNQELFSLVNSSVNSN
ncbi:MAG: hypothetical protein ABJN95_14035 [Maribacter sp.]|uniref:hypothetical protein n=1 Tax=Maribacter sp. TaxID=1897614 RepID=UPI00329690B9